MFVYINLNIAFLFRLSLGFCSLLWLDNYSKVCGVYKSQCEYLKPRYLTMHERIVDVGFLGKWLVIGKKMEEFDINPQEWAESGAEEESVVKSYLKSVQLRVNQLNSNIKSIVG